MGRVTIYGKPLPSFLSFIFFILMCQVPDSLAEMAVFKKKYETWKYLYLFRWQISKIIYNRNPKK